MDEKRKHERFSLVIPTRLVLSHDSHDAEVIEINTCNICAGGAYFKSNQTIQEGTRVSLDFVLPIEKLAQVLGVNSFVKIEGKVVRVDIEGMAVSFDTNYKIMPYRNI
jgi:hypothetical protein